jgi:hypothetical protein
MHGMGTQTNLDEWQAKLVTFWTSPTDEERADLDDLAVYMDYTVREELHHELDVPCSPQTFWDAYVERVGEGNGRLLWRCIQPLTLTPPGPRR